jgi:hypothetical protein
MQRAAQSGDVRPFISTMAQGLPQGMSSGDGWKHVEALMVGAMIAKGDMVGAQHARELVFQMSHVGAVQGLMRARQLMGDDGKGDLVGAAQALAQAYYAMPDGGMGKVYVTNQGLVGQRFNETTGQKVGGMFPITPGFLDGLINQAQDPQTYLKTLRESQKHNADIVKTYAETAHKIAETTQKLPADVEHIRAQAEQSRAAAEQSRATADYYRERPGLERDRSENVLIARIAAAQAKAAAGDPKAEAMVITHLDQLQEHYWPTKTIEGAPKEFTADEARQAQSWRDMLRINRSADPVKAQEVAKGLSTGQYTLGEALNGGGVILNKDKTPLRGFFVTPSTLQLWRKSATPPPASPIGAAAPAR